MQPDYLTSTDWLWVASFVEAILWFTLLGIVSGLAFLTAHSVLPSLIANRELAPETRLLQMGAYVASFISLGVALYILAIALGYAFAVIERVFPRWWI
ncbi:MAG TPA: hypothetical protein VHS06_09775 [Chloroflexota bacterium]|nr:hypothetical protein [Chloroflexota bacterium]